jgi:AcrR family transcriptional regulator
VTSPAPPSRTAVAAPGLRKDAERNRCRIIAAARRAYSADGLGVSMAAVAREAGVGIATLFRRFPTREDLIAAVFEETMDAYAAAIETALADPDPWHGFTTYIETICGMQADDRGFADVLSMTFPTARGLEARRDDAHRGVVRLIERAKAAGRLRPDFTPEDIVILLIANAGLVTATRDAAPEAWRRLVGYLLQAFAVTGPAPLPESPAPVALYRAMIRLGRS